MSGPRRASAGRRRARRRCSGGPARARSGKLASRGRAHEGLQLAPGRSLTRDRGVDVRLAGERPTGRAADRHDLGEGRREVEEVSGCTMPSAMARHCDDALGRLELGDLSPELLVKRSCAWLSSPIEPVERSCPWTSTVWNTPTAKSASSATVALANAMPATASARRTDSNAQTRSAGDRPRRGCDAPIPRPGTAMTAAGIAESRTSDRLGRRPATARSGWRW